MTQGKHPIRFLLVSCCLATSFAWLVENVAASRPRANEVHEVFAQARTVCPVITSTQVEAIVDFMASNHLPAR